MCRCISAPPCRARQALSPAPFFRETDLWGNAVPCPIPRPCAPPFRADERNLFRTSALFLNFF